MTRTVIIELCLAILFVALGFILRGQGTYYKDKIEYMAGMGMIALGMVITGIVIYHVFRNKPDPKK